MEKRMDAVMTEDQVVRYTRLTARRMEIVMHSGASWRPEYGQELEEIDKELAELRRHVDAALEVKAADERLVPEDAGRAAMEELPCDGNESFDMSGDCLECGYYNFCERREEAIQADLNGGRTPYLYDIDGNEYYTTRDGVRHYTRVEG